MPKALPGIENCKKKKETDWIVPDILIHVRKSENRDNFAVFEIKSLSNLDDCDRRKLAGMTFKEGIFKYDVGVGVEFHRNYFSRFLFVNGALRGRPARVELEDTSRSSSEALINPHYSMLPHSHNTTQRVGASKKT